MSKKGQHHGGAWKVAYADFATAMMALFMVLWISAQDEEIVLATAQYFQNPFGAAVPSNSGVLDKEAQSSFMQDGEGKNADTVVDFEYMQRLAHELTRLLQVGETDEDSITIKVTSEGMLIDLHDHGQKPFFQPDSNEFTEWGAFVIQNLAWIIDRHSFRVQVEGHLAKGFSSPDPNYTAWEMSTERANATRRALQRYAVDPEKFARVIGYADTQPIDPKRPADARNQRISLQLLIPPHH